MEFVEMDHDLPLPSSYEQTRVAKGKRSKRMKLQSPFMAAMASSSSTSLSDGDYYNNLGVVAPPSPATSAESSDGGVTEEEHDLANCLILLAQGSSKEETAALHHAGEDDHSRLVFGQRLAEPATATAGKYVYECKTCNRCFTSFQALGGHRASHKKPRSGVAEDDYMALQVYKHPSPHTSNKSRVHECSICGAEFSSGQALGGHKRRHRATAMAGGASAGDSVRETKKQRTSTLSLDLNLPAPEEDFPGSPRGFTFAGKPPLVFAATPLSALRPMIDCHY